MLLFFVNGCMRIIKHEYLPEDNTIDFYKYEMRFLAESDSEIDIDIIMFDELDNKIVSHNIVNGLSLIKINVTKFMEKYNYQYESYIKIKYVVKKSNNEVLYNGSFPIISPCHDKSLKFVSVSCNNNNNKDIDLWKHLNKRDPDIVLHIGNQIYSDHIYGEDRENIYIEYAKLYRESYGDISQGMVMRNCLNIMILNSHDISSGFGSNFTFQNKKNPYFARYYIAGMKAYLDYQHQLHTDILVSTSIKNKDGFEMLTSNDDYYDIIHNGNQIYYSINYGKYCIIVLDERHCNYHHNEVLTEKQLKWINNILDDTTKNNVIIVSPIPIGNLNKAESAIIGITSYEGSDELLHPYNHDNTVKLLNILNTYNDKDYVLFSGNIRKTFINKILTKDKSLEIEQLVSSGISSKPSGYDSVMFRLLMWIIENINCEYGVDIDDYYVLTEKKDVSCNYNYGYLEDDKLYNYYVKGFDGELCFQELNYK